MRQASRTFLFLLALSTVALPLGAQPRGASNYTGAGGGAGGAGGGGGLTDLFTSEEEIPSEDELEAALVGAPWKLGILRLQPWLGIRDARLVTDEGFDLIDEGPGVPSDPDAPTTTDDGSTDFTITAGAGLRAYVKLGESAVLAAHGLPEYVWWVDDDDRSQVNGRYGVGIFQHLNRLALEVSARREERQGIVSSEVLQLLTTRTETGRAAASVRLGNRTSWVTSLSRTTVEIDDDRELDERLTGAGRETDAVRSQIQWEGPNGWAASVGGEVAQIASTTELRDLAADSTSLLLGIGYTGNRFASSVALQRRDLEPDGDSELVATQATTGSANFRFDLTERDALSLYGSRNLQLSTSVDYAQLTAERMGLRYGRSFPRWKRNEVRLDLYAETGTDDFEPAAGALVGPRSDDVTAFGGWLSLKIRKATTLRFGGGELTIDSELPGEDRTYRSLGFSIQISFDFGKLDLLGDGARSSGRW